jgi:hypothetical protein
MVCVGGVCPHAHHFSEIPNRSLSSYCFFIYKASKGHQDTHYEYSIYSNFIARKHLFAEAENTPFR